IFAATRDFDLAERYYSKARDMGTSDETVAIGMADSYLAQGKDKKAEQSLASLGNAQDYQENYDFQLAWGNVYNQRHDNLQAISSFARANQIATEDPTAERAMLQVAGQEGATVVPGLSMRSELATGPVYQDPAIYQMSTRLIGVIVQPIVSQETVVGSQFRYHRKDWLPINGYFGIRNFNGDLALTSEPAIVQRNTYDTLFDANVAPSFHWGDTRITLNPGLEFTLRRDTVS